MYHVMCLCVRVCLFFVVVFVQITTSELPPEYFT